MGQPFLGDSTLGDSTLGDSTLGDSTLGDSTPVVMFEDVSFWYEPAKKLFKNFNWTVQRGESWSILGPSGCGKSTLLYLIAGLRQPSAGRIFLNGKAVEAPHRDVSLMLQDYGLLNWYTNERNIELGLQIRGITGRERKARVNYWLQELDIEPIRHSYPLQISGGQRQRVALARVLALQSPLQLLDEPLSAVDELTRERLQAQLVEINRKLETSSLTVTHNVEEAVLLGDNALVITEHNPITHFYTQQTRFTTIPERDDPAFIATCRHIRQFFAAGPASK
ncbi:MAG: ATP-binding cassette domain-containing protein [Chloroflexota bacterium]